MGTFIVRQTGVGAQLIVDVEQLPLHSAAPAALDPPTIAADTISWSQAVDTPADIPCVREYELLYEGGHCNLNRSYNLSAFSSSIPLELEKGGDYTVRVRAVNLFTSGEWSGAVNLHIPSTR